MILVHSKVHRLLLQMIDAALGVLAFIAAHLIRTYLLDPIIPFELPNVGTLQDYSILLPPIALLGPFILYRLNFYNLTLTQRPANILNLSFQGGLLLFILLVVLQFMFKIQLSRIVFVIFVPVFSSFIFGRKLFSQHLRAIQAKRNKNQRNMIVISDQHDLSRWETRMKQRPQYGFQICRTIQFCDFNVETLVKSLHEHCVHLVVFDIKNGQLSKIMDGVRACEEEGIETWFSTNFFNTRIAQPSIAQFSDQTFLIFRATPDSSWELFFKEVMDRVVSLTLLVLSSPLLLITALLIKCSSHGPILFRQQRSGHYGRPFTMYKFRSMVSNAEQRKQELKAFNEMSGPVFKVSKDPRITPIGNWLRRTSIDELPQLFNVLCGEMSLVGPRPLPVDETLAISENAQRRRLSVKPGLTCLWQIGGRNHIHSFKDWVKMDLDYIDHWSLFLDLKILLKTIPVVLFFKGAK